MNRCATECRLSVRLAVVLGEAYAWALAELLRCTQRPQVGLNEAGGSPMWLERLLHEQLVVQEHVPLGGRKLRCRMLPVS